MAKVELDSTRNRNWAIEGLRYWCHHWPGRDTATSSDVATKLCTQLICPGVSGGVAVLDGLHELPLQVLLRYLRQGHQLRLRQTTQHRRLSPLDVTATGPTQREHITVFNHWVRFCFQIVCFQYWIRTGPFSRFTCRRKRYFEKNNGLRII